jgi:hypothetical protein
LIRRLRRPRFRARHGAGRNFLYIDRSFGVNNGGTGAKANGSANVAVVINNSVFGGDQIDVAFTAGGSLFSTKTNVITGNLTSDGAPSNIINLN